MENPNLDPLTGLFSRRYALAQLETMCPSAAQNSDIFGILYLEFDKFKDINEIYGHYNADAYLQGIATEIQRLAENNLVARFGGDEFVILMSGANQREAAELAENIRANIEKFVIEFETYSLGPLTLTIGVACFPDDGASATALIEAADAAMFVGKNGGRNCVVCARNPLRRDAPPH